MATLSVTPIATSLKISGRTTVSGTISWTCPTVPEGSIITSCVLTGTPTFSNTTVTVNGTSVTNNIQFTIDLGTSNTTTSVPTTGKGRTSTASGTVEFNSLSYTVTYEEKVEIEGGTGTTKTNIMPSFLTGGWYLPTDCTYVSSTDTDYGFTALSTWSGLTLSMPTEWAGKTITFGCTDISSNAGFYIQNTSTWENIVVLTASSKKVTVTIPTGVSAVMCLQVPSTTGDVSINGLYAYEGSEGSGDNTGMNILPAFSTWTQESGLTVQHITDSDIVFTTQTAWTGVYLWGSRIFSSGDTITFGVSSIDSYSEFSICDSTGAVIATVSSAQLSQTVVVTGTAPYDIFITTSDATKQATIMGAYLIIDTKGEGGGESGGDTPSKTTYVQLGNRIVGYMKPTNETSISGATTVSTASELTTAISNASAGSTIYVKAGTYTFNGGLTINKSGTSSNYITIKNYPNETPIISNSSITFASGTKYVNFEGFKIQDLIDLDWGNCLTVANGCSYINLRNLEITNIKCKAFDSSSSNGCNPLVLYGDGTNSISNCLIENCYVHDCDTGWSEAITLNGNVTDCVVRNCCVDNNQNIGIDLAGNFSWTGTIGDNTNQARNTIVENNLVMNCQSPYATSAGLYCDGSRDITFRYNVIYNAQCGIELGAEESGATVQNFYVYGNLIIDSGRSIGAGGYQTTSATHQNTYIYNNTIVCGNSNKENLGLMLERTSNLYFVNNIVYGSSNSELFEPGSNAKNLNIANNCWYKTGGSKPTEDTTGIFKDPLFVNNNGLITGDYTLQEGSSCINSGINSSELYRGNLDLNGNNRLVGVIDIGAFESNIKNIIQNIKMGQSNVKIMYGGQAISKIYIGNTLIYLV